MSDRKFKNDYDFCKIGSYEPANKVQELSILQWMSLCLEIIWEIALVLIVSSPYMLKRLFRFFSGDVPKDIRGEIALVTGSGNGLGRSISLALAKRGAKLAIVDLDHKAAQQTAEEVRAITGDESGAKIFVADVSSKEDVKNMKADVVKEFGAPVSILVNNAGLIPTVSLTNGTDEQVQRIIDVNLTSHFWMLRTFLPEMKERNYGHIVTIASIASLVGCKRFIAYSATKFALRGMNQALSWELSEDGYNGIHVSTVYPYFIATRQQLVDMVDYLRIPLVDPDIAAERVVRGILTNQSEFSIPEHHGFILRTGSGILPTVVVRKIAKIFGGELMDKQ